MFIVKAIERMRTLPAGKKAMAANALTRSLLQSDLNAEERSIVEENVYRLLDDPSDLVRRGVAEAVAEDPRAPRSLIHLIANDRFFVAEPVLRQSPVLTTAQLVDLVAIGEPDVRVAIAGRKNVCLSVSAAIAEVCDEGACLALLRNSDADILEDTLRTIVARFGDRQDVRAELLGWPDLPIDIRHELLSRLGTALKVMVGDSAWMGEKRVETLVEDATEKVTLRLFEDEDPDNARKLVAHLHDTDQLTTRLLVRAAATGHLVVLETGLALLAGQDQRRVFAIIMHGGAAAFRALLDRAGVSRTYWPVFEVARTVYGEVQAEMVGDDWRRFRRIVVDRTLVRFESVACPEADKLLALLHRYSADAARDAARHGSEPVGPRLLEQRAA